jgi:hypothetical protein
MVSGSLAETEAAAGLPNVFPVSALPELKKHL